MKPIYANIQTKPRKCSILKAFPLMRPSGTLKFYGKSNFTVVYLLSSQFVFYHGQIYGLCDHLVIVRVVPLGGKLHEDVTQWSPFAILQTKCVCEICMPLEATKSKSGKIFKSYMLIPGACDVSEV